MILKDSIVFNTRFDANTKDVRFAFSPFENLIMSRGFQQRCLLYDQVKVTSYTLSISPYLPNASDTYVMRHRWQRDDFPILERVFKNEPSLPGLVTGSTQGVIRAIPNNVEVGAAGSSKMRYLNPNTQNTIIQSIYASSIQEKSQYMSTYRILDVVEAKGDNEELLDQNIVEFLKKIDEQT